MTPHELYQWRLQAQLTQLSLSALLGVHVITLSRWERGESPIPPYLDMALWALEHGYEPAPTA